VLATEAPDFLVESAERVLGIEILDYVRGEAADGSPVRKAEQDHDEVAEIARVAFEADGHCDVAVDFLWSDHGSLNRQTRREIGEATARLVRQHIPAGVYETRWLRWDDFEATPLCGLVHSISIMRMRQSSAWTCSDGGFVTATVPEIVRLIESKNMKVPSYRQRCQELWLVVVADGERISSNLDVTDDVLNTEFTSDFDSVLLYPRLEHTVHALPVRRAATRQHLGTLQL